MTVDHSIDPADGVETVEIIKPGISFLGEIIVDYKMQAIKKVRKNHVVLNLWKDGSKLSDGRCEAAICWKDKKSNWTKKNVFLWKNKKSLDAEIWSILEALEIATRNILAANTTLITIFCNSQKALTAIQQPPSEKENRFLKGQICYTVKKLMLKRHKVGCQ